jgi:hypothetical protein
MRILGFVIMRTSTYRRHIDHAAEAGQTSHGTEEPRIPGNGPVSVLPHLGEAEPPARRGLRVVRGEMTDWI